MNERVPYEIILLAKSQNTDALQEVLNHFAPMIRSRSLFFAKDAFGNNVKKYDLEMQQYIAATLLMKIANNFDPDKIPEKRKK